MKVIVTAGPTREHIDAVRFITNASSGKMGYAVAAEAAAAGHQVTLISGPVAIAPPAGVQLVLIASVTELAQALQERFDACDALIMAAAVGDFRVQEKFDAKIPRCGGPVRITLVPTADILAALGARRRRGQVLVGFAVEPEPNEAKARQELAAKNCDYLVLNAAAAMGADESEASILSPEGLALPPAKRSKGALAKEIIALCEKAHGRAGA